MNFFHTFLGQFLHPFRLFQCFNNTRHNLFHIRNALASHFHITTFVARPLTTSVCLVFRIEKVDLEQGISIGGGENPELKLVEEENMQEILEVIGTLPDLQQSILRMKHLEGFEVEEIARLTGSTPVAVRTNLSRARKRVKEQFMIHSKVWN